MSRARLVRLSCMVMSTPSTCSDGIRPDLHLPHRLEQVVRAFEREVGRLDRHHEMRGRDERVDRQQPQRRRAVDDDVGVVGFERGELFLETEVRVEFSHQLGLELGQRDARRRNAEMRLVGRADDGRQRGAAIAGHRLEHVRADRRHVEKRHGAVGLGIQVDEQRRPAAEREGGGEVDGGRGLTHAALLIGNGQDHRQSGRVPCAFYGKAGRSHLVLAHLLGIQALQPVLEALGVLSSGRRRVAWRRRGRARRRRRARVSAAPAPARRTAARRPRAPRRSASR